MSLHSEKDGEQSIRAFGETPRSNRVDTTKALHGNPGVAAEYLWSYSWVARDALAMIKAATRENQVKLTVSVPPSLHVLLRSWALCEGRELTSVVLQCVEPVSYTHLTLPTKRIV